LRSETSSISGERQRCEQSARTAPITAAYASQRIMQGFYHGRGWRLEEESAQRFRALALQRVTEVKSRGAIAMRDFSWLLRHYPAGERVCRWRSESPRCEACAASEPGAITNRRSASCSYRGLQSRTSGKYPFRGLQQHDNRLRF
jgi:hypothetical protein